MMSATVLAGAYLTFGTATAAADDPPPPPLHQIHYTVWAEQPFTAEIYYRDTDPPNWAEYSHNPYLFSPNIEADVGPNQQWNLDGRFGRPRSVGDGCRGHRRRVTEETQHPLCACRRRRGREDQSGTEGCALLDSSLVITHWRRVACGHRFTFQTTQPLLAVLERLCVTG